jgi:hypothetical protein
MKILFLDHPQFTSATYFLWLGLNEIFGPNCIVDYPSMPTHHDSDSFDLSKTEWFQKMSEQSVNEKLPVGIPPFSPGETLINGDNTVINRQFVSMKLDKLPFDQNEETIITMLKQNEFAFIVLGNSHRVPTFALARLRDRVTNMPPIIYLDAGERDELNEHWIHVFRPVIVFKQILTPEVLKKGLSVKIPNYELKLLPLPLSSPMVDHPYLSIDAAEENTRRLLNHADPNYLPPLAFKDMLNIDLPENKTKQVFYHLGETWEKRKEVVDAASNMMRVHQDDRAKHRKGLTPEYYQNNMVRSRMAISMRGSGRDTFLYWNIPLYETLMICDGTMGCIHPYPFTDKINARFYSSIEELSSILREYIHDGQSSINEEERLKIARAGKKHLYQYHSNAARAIFFLDRVNEIIGCLPLEILEIIKNLKKERDWDDRPWNGKVSSCE